MNRHNFHQFNPNSYKKHLSPFGQNVLDTLIKHWRTGFDNKENRHHHQFATNPNRRNVGGCYGYSHGIPSIPSSPVAGDRCERESHPTANNLVTDNHLTPALPIGRAYDSSNDIGTANYVSSINQATLRNDGHFAIPKTLIDHAQPTTSIGNTYYEHIVTGNADTIVQQQHSVQIDQNQHFKTVVPNISIKNILHGTHPEPANTVIPESRELVKTVDIPNTNEEILTANDMVTPAINFEKVNENFLSSRNRIQKITTTDMPAQQFLQILNNKTIEKPNQTRDEVMVNRNNGLENDVQWDDMFDTELFSDVSAPMQLIAPLAEENGFKIEFPKDKSKTQSLSKNKLSKRKTQSKICDAVTKKVKKVKCENKVTDTSNKNFRKVKYTKAVKNWLDDVDPKNCLEDKTDCNDVILPIATSIHGTNNEKLEFDGKIISFGNHTTSSLGIEETLQQEPEAFKNELRPHLEEAVDQGAKKNSKINQPKAISYKTVTIQVSSETETQNNPKGKSKKVVQARLAQKDGKMKFGPPTKEKNDSKADSTTDKETKNKEPIKEKKATKAKFVAPIKSQIPVKNETFDVKTIVDSNLYLIDDFINAENNDIAIVLTYRNGFCQLNNHHTEDTCIPEGVMIHSQHQFFYFKDNTLNSNVIRRLIEGFSVICYNGKEILIYLTSKGIELKQDAFNFNDAKIGCSLIDPDNPPENFAELQKLLDFTPEFTIATECVLQKAAWYTTLLRECFDKLKSLLTENSVWNIFIEIEMRLLPVIAGMEHRGVCVDLEKLKSMEEILLTKMKAVEQECYKAAGKTFQINSALQVRTILYDELQLDTKSNLKIKETIGKGAKSTSETMLRGLVSVHPLPRLILEYRHLHKAHATFLTGIAQHVKDGLVKPTWVQTAAATGRIASNNPNLQAIPKAPFSLVMFPETSDDQGPQLNFRCVYTARPGHWLVAADFKHVECRVFAHAASDAALLAALRDQRDLFRVLAAKWLNKPVDDISTEDRERTKRIIYASLYGAGARKLMEILHVSYEQALSVMSSFNRTFPALKRFGQAAVDLARAGLLRTLCGRARRFRHIGSADAALRAHAERQAVNFVVQGSAADLCKTAMVVVQRQLEQQSLQGRLLLQIHDELVWEVADDHVVRAAALIKEAMENVGRQCGMDLALPVELTRGRSWGEMHPFSECLES